MRNPARRNADSVEAQGFGLPAKGLDLPTAEGWRESGAVDVLGQILLRHKIAQNGGEAGLN